MQSTGTRTQDRVSELIGAVRALAPLIARERGSFDRERRLSDPVFAALADAGLFRLWLPEALGGHELSPLDFMRVVEAAAALDGSVGWLVGNGGGASRAGGLLPDAVTREWFADPRAFIVASTASVGTAMPVDGGFRLSGRWSFGSGAHHATRFMVLAAAQPDDPDSPRLFCHIAREHVSVIDNWHVSGLRGTGSCDFEARDVFVSAQHVHPFLGHQPSASGVVYRMPPISVFAWTVSVVPLGIARGAIDAFKELATAKRRQGMTALLRDQEQIQAMVGHVEAMHRAARAFLIDVMTELMAATDVGGERLTNARAVFRTACAHAAETALSIMEMLVAAAGAAAIFESNPLERAMRDVNAAAKHIAMSPNAYPVAGRVSLGLDPGTARF